MHISEIVYRSFNILKFYTQEFLKYLSLLCNLPFKRSSPDQSFDNMPDQTGRIDNTDSISQPIVPSTQSETPKPNSEITITWDYLRAQEENTRLEGIANEQSSEQTAVVTTVPNASDSPVASEFVMVDIKDGSSRPNTPALIANV